MWSGFYLSPRTFEIQSDIKIRDSETLEQYWNRRGIIWLTDLDVSPSKQKRSSQSNCKSDCLQQGGWGVGGGNQDPKEQKPKLKKKCRY